MAVINRVLADTKKLRPQDELYIALSELDFSWYPAEVEQARQLWQDGLHIADIAGQLARDVDEAALLIMDLARRGKIEHRKMGVFGEVNM